MNNGLTPEQMVRFYQELNRHEWADGVDSSTAISIAEIHARNQTYRLRLVLEDIREKYKDCVRRGGCNQANATPAEMCAGCTADEALRESYD